MGFLFKRLQFKFYSWIGDFSEWWCIFREILLYLVDSCGFLHRRGPKLPKFYHRNQLLADGGSTLRKHLSSGQMESYVTNLDFPEIRGPISLLFLPFGGFLVVWGRDFIWPAFMTSKLSHPKDPRLDPEMEGWMNLYDARDPGPKK